MSGERPTTILIVEDERIVAMDLGRSLEDLGYVITGMASSAEEAIHCASERCPDLVLMDIRIKGPRDGIETAEILWRRFRIPIVYLTAHANEATVERAKRTEPFGYLIKPFKASELRASVEIALYKHQMERRLRERERWFSTTLRSIGDAVITTDLDARVTFMNMVAEMMTGWRSEDAAGRPFEEIVRLVDQDAPDMVISPVRRALDERQVVEFARDLVLIAKEKSRRLVTDRAAPILEKDQLLGAVMVFRDVGAQRQMQRQLELADRLASLGTMAAGVAHDINNPLAFILANADYVRRELGWMRTKTPEERNALADAGKWKDIEAALLDIMDGTDRIRRIVSDLKAYSRPEERPGHADVVRVLKWSLRVCAHELRHRARVAIKQDDVPPVQAEEARLGQIFVNLLVNAAHAIAPGNVDNNEVRINIGTDRLGRVFVEIRDSGSGMTEEVQRRIFEPFFTTKTSGVGTGLGLSICKGIVQSIGGEITVESQLGRGTTFSVYLPAAPRETLIKRPSKTVPPLTRRGRVLVIDDEVLLRKSIARVLEPDHEVIAPESPAEALSTLGNGETFDVILCDLMMADITGMDVYERVLQIRPDMGPRIVFLSGGAFTTKAVEFLRAVPNRYLEKPFAPLQLQQIVSEMVAEADRASAGR